MTEGAPRTAIIGAGLAGLGLALGLSARGLPVTLFDAAAQPGGRLASRALGPWQVDHGGQFLTARDPGFRAVLDQVMEDGHAGRWNARVVRLSPDGGIEPHPVERFVGTPHMDALVQGLAARLPVPARPRLRSMIAAITGRPGQWYLHMADGGSEGPYSRVALALPAPAAADLLAPVAPPLSAQARRAIMAPCWALMLAFDAPIERPPWDAAFLAGAGGDQRPLSWIAHDGGKPGRGGPATFTAHAAPGWSTRHSAAPEGTVVAALLTAFRTATGIMESPAIIASHFWPQALPTVPLGQDCLWDAGLGLGACGDWCLEARAEAAFVSGARLAAAMEA